MHKVVLVRHGESVWNQENRFTGWIDVSVSEKGIQEARKAGRLLRQGGYTFNALAIGPVIQEVKRPVNDPSRGATVTDIVNTVAITSIQEQERGSGS
jgi:bisphosphoglycerate-dependent phosphoglycerate mutase